MIQAIVIKNPKWEPYSKASDAFKATTVKDGETVVLVVRGRCKEKNVKNSKQLKSGKTAEWLKEKAEAAAKALAPKAAKAAAIVALMFCFAATAQDNLVNKLATTSLTNAQTVSESGPGFFAWQANQVAVFQLSVGGTNASATNGVLVIMEASDNGTDYVTNRASIVAVSAGTSAGTTIQTLTNTYGAQYWRVNVLVNSNTTTVSIPRFTFRPIAQ